MEQKYIDRFWSKVAVSTPDACWPWTAFRNPKGYGKFFVERKHIGTHRVAFEIAYAAPPDDLMVMHTCDNPPCCNPAHLKLGTGVDNMGDKMARGRHTGRNKTVCVRGHSLHEASVLWDNKKKYFRRECRVCKQIRGKLAYADKLAKRRTLVVLLAYRGFLHAA